jgi:hypothetical protein
MAETFRYAVEARERGDYVDPAGPWEVIYMGSDSDEALAEAQAAVVKGKDVRIVVGRRHA